MTACVAAPPPLLLLSPLLQGGWGARGHRRLAGAPGGRAPGGGDGGCAGQRAALLGKVAASDRVWLRGLCDVSLESLGPRTGYDQPLVEGIPPFFL